MYGKQIIKPLYHTRVETIFLFDNKKLALDYKKYIHFSMSVFGMSPIDFNNGHIVYDN